MKKILVVIAIAGMAAVSAGRAQTVMATLKTPTGERPIRVVEQSGNLYLPAEEATAALGGSLTGSRQGYRIDLAGRTAGFTADSRFGAAGDELIEMPSPPIFIEASPYVPWQFFRDLLRTTSDLDLTWEPGARVFEVRRFRLDSVEAQISVVNIEGMTKIVVQFPRKVEYSVRREENAYVIEIPNPIRTRAADQTFTSPLLDRVLVRENQIVVNLASRDIAGDAYAIESPFRIVLDLQRGASPVPDAQPSLPGSVRRPAHPPGVRTIVLDPGHGGKEVGAIGPNGLVEKETTLAICRRLQSMLASELGVRVILTRDSDELVPHDQRTATANQFRADLFLSIHLNASHSPAARGAETYFLSLEASDELARAAAERENAVIGGASAPGVSSDLNLILWDLAHQEYLRESSRFANLIQSEMNVTSGVENRGVKQAPFRVLIGATMPSALVEVGFISNPQEEARLGSAEHQNEIAQAIVRAVRRYKEDYEARLGGPAQDPARVGSAPSTAAPAPAPADRSGR